MVTAQAARSRGASLSQVLRLVVPALLLPTLLVASTAAECSRGPSTEPQHEANTEHAIDESGVAAATPDPPEVLAPGSSIPVFDLTADSLGMFAPAWPELDGSCYIYDRYVVVAWGSPDPQPVAIVRERGGEGDTAALDCPPDSLAGDFVVRNEWAEYFSGMWGDLLLIDSGTGDIRSLIIYHVPTRRKVLEVEGAGETEGWVDEHTVRIWVLAATDLPRSVCPDIPRMLGVGVDSLYALNLETMCLTPLGPWRCHPLQ